MTAPPCVAFRPDPLAEPPPLPSDERSDLLLAMVFATALHVAIGALLPSRRAMDLVPASALEVIDVMQEEPPPPEPDPQQPNTQRDEPPAATITRPSQSQPVKAAPAQAAQALTRSDAADGQLDLTDAIVTGSAAAYAGGTTSPRGTSAKPARGQSSRGVPGGTLPEAPSAAATADRSRKAGLIGRLAWSCPFPSEADADGIDHGVVSLTVRVDATAKVEGVTVVSDPGHGFGAAARRCALSKQWQSALDREGRSIASSITLQVRFTR